MIRLKQADISERDQIIDFRKETVTSVKRISGGVGLESAEDIQKWLDHEYVPHYGKVPEMIFLAFDEFGKMVGIADLRLEQNEFISNFAGQIGYTVRPSERGHGYATEILKEVVKQADALGMRNVLVTCNEDNLASARVIEKAGGVFEKIIPHPSYPNVKRYRFLR
jgi:predicted acetyltransferase